MKDSEMRKLFPEIQAHEIKQGDVILTVDNDECDALEHVNCVDNGDVWQEDVNGDIHREHVSEMEEEYPEIRLVKRTKQN